MCHIISKVVFPSEANKTHKIRGGVYSKDKLSPSKWPPHPCYSLFCSGVVWNETCQPGKMALNIMGINTCIYIFQMHNRTENTFLSISNTRCVLKHNVKTLHPLEIIITKRYAMQCWSGKVWSLPLIYRAFKRSNITDVNKMKIWIWLVLSSLYNLECQNFLQSGLMRFKLKIVMQYCKVEWFH